MTKRKSQLYLDLLECQLQCNPGVPILSREEYVTLFSQLGGCTASQLVSLLPTCLLPLHSFHSQQGDFIKSQIG